MSLSFVKPRSVLTTINSQTIFCLSFVNRQTLCGGKRSYARESESSTNSGDRNPSRMAESNNKVLFVGLGNLDMPGTRHSVGMKFIDRMAQILELKLQKKKECMGLVASTNISGVEVILLKPKIAMNLNGTSVYKTVRNFDVDISNVYVLHDDLERAVGKLSIKESGSAGGHNGVRSTINSLKTDAFPRLRIGIDRPSSANMVSRYVMEKFTPDEQRLIEKSISKGIGQLCRHVENKIAINIGHAFRKQQSEESEEKT